MMGEAIQWDIVFQQYKNSGLTRQAFCTEHKLSYTKFKYQWYRQTELSGAGNSLLKRESNPGCFESVMVKNTSGSTKPVIKIVELTIHLPNQIRCEIKSNLTMDEFPQLLQQLVILC
jgi:hypothetical protein